MGNINWWRVLSGGVFATAIISVIWLPVLLAFRQDYAHMAASLGLVIRPTLRMLIYGIVAMPTAGILAVWLYAAIRPRYGAGPRTAAIAGAAIWLATLIVDGAWASFGVMPLPLFAITKSTDLVAIVVGTIAGAWVYKEPALAVAG